MARGRKALISWIAADGSTHEEQTRHIHYGYFERVYLSVPKNGQRYEDRVHTTRRIPFKKKRVRFTITDTVTFEWITDQDSKKDRLQITTRSARGKVVSGHAGDMPGAQHPHSPFIGFTVDGEERRIALLPSGIHKKPENYPRILKMKFTP